jgi:Plasmid pRiA4b ORF-3-like protein
MICRNIGTNSRCSFRVERPLRVDLCSLFQRFMRQEAVWRFTRLRPRPARKTPSLSKGMLTMPTERKSSGNEIYQIKVTLSRTAPPIWRRLLVPSDITLSGLHHLLQLAMGWTDSHLHEFLFRGQSYGPTDPERGVEEAIDERKVRLNQLLTRVGAKIVYTYDFGDGWEHGIVLEKGLPEDPNMTYPLCMGGAGACPPEDCGGIGEFYNLLEASRNPRHPQHEELLEWVGEDYDPEKFSIESINRILHGRKKRAARSSG